jgi:hypothetical protein
MPLLSAVAANYIATDTHIETKVEIPQNSPMIVAVRETAIKSLESKAAPVPSPPPAPSPTAPTDSTGGASGGGPAGVSAAPVSVTK